MLKVLVFDWDGTLADSVSKIVACKKFLAEKYHLPAPSEEMVRSVLGTKFEEALANCFPDATQITLIQLGQEFHALMQQDSYQANLFPGANAVLDALKKRGIKLAIASSKDRREMDKAIVHNQLEGIFECICCGKEYQEKPHPAMLNYIKKKFNAQPDECLMVGDTTTDIQFAANAGIQTVCVTFGALPKLTLQSMNPCAFIEEWKQLLEVIDRLCYSTQNYCQL